MRGLATSLEVPSSEGVPERVMALWSEMASLYLAQRRARDAAKADNAAELLAVPDVGGALVGRAIDTRGDRATGTILGAAGGALLGKEIDSKRRCR
jgi:hypothetical protein